MNGNPIYTDIDVDEPPNSGNIVNKKLHKEEGNSSTPDQQPISNGKTASKNHYTNVKANPASSSSNQGMVVENLYVATENSVENPIYGDGDSQGATGAGEYSFIENNFSGDNTLYGNDISISPSKENLTEDNQYAVVMKKKKKNKKQQPQKSNVKNSLPRDGEGDGYYQVGDAIKPR